MIYQNDLSNIISLINKYMNLYYNLITIKFFKYKLFLSFIFYNI